MQSSTLLNCTVSSIKLILLCLAGARILLRRGGGERQFAVYKTPCCGECSCYCAAFLKCLDRDTARLGSACFYLKKNTNTYLYGCLVVTATRNRFHSSSPK
jgi:hypothetical protein